MIENIEENRLLSTIVEGIENVKGEDIIILDLREIENSVCQFFVICTGNSNTQVAAIASSVEKTTRNQIKERPLHIEGQDNAQWILIDYASIVVHVFQQQIREHYDIESMWGDAKIIAVQN